MGNRVKGRPKKKGIKAALSSSAGSKRKLSRMGKRQKKEHAGLEASFIGRSKCLKMLQITLKDFRRLCILKGIYPREPIGRVPGKKKGQTFYHIKDIRAIAHEPILEKFRDFKAFMKKVKRAAGRNELDEAKRKNALAPTYTLHHLVKERYPRFVDALSDMDDALTLSYLFAALPGEGPIQSKVTNKAKTLVAAWGAYCATTSSITKSFISVKGVYLEATIHATPIRWVVPHAFTQYLPEDVDYRVMMTFFEFYETLLNFVLFKLYNDIGVRFPFSQKDLGKEVAGSTSAVLGANLRALTNALNPQTSAVSNIVSAMLNLESTTANDSTAKKTSKEGSKKSKSLISSFGALPTLPDEDQSGGNGDKDDDDDDDEDSVDVAGPLKAALESVSEEHARTSHVGARHELDEDGLKRKRLFSGLTLFLSREVPRGYLELVGLAYGAKVGWEGDDSPISIKDSTITHHIVDRPRLPDSYESLPKSREYVQPQWILDCANFLFLLPIAKYAVGASLPPHLSPWVDDGEEGYKPAYAEEIERLKNGEVLDADEEMGEAGANESSDDEEEDTDASKEKLVKGKQSGKVKQTTAKEIDNEDGEDDDDDDDADEEDDVEEEEEDENEEEDTEDVSSEKERQRQDKRRQKEAAEAHALAKTMMNRKAAHLYGRMQHGIAQKQAKIEELHNRRKEIDHSRKREKGAKTVLKQKVERLKDERKSIENAYDKVGATMSKRKNKKTRMDST